MTEKYMNEHFYEDTLKEFWSNGVPLNFVGGEWVDSKHRVEIFDPSSGLAYTTVPDTSSEDTNIAVEAAQKAQVSWSRLTFSERAKYLDSLYVQLQKFGEKIAFLESVDSGNPLPSTQRDIGLALRYLSEWPGRVISSAGKFTQSHSDGMSLVSREPYGVVGKIIAFNHPVLFAIAGLIYPLMAGNAIVIKTSEQTPVATLALGRILQNSLPDGLVNIISGGVTPGDTLVTHTEVKRIAFIGSDATALAIQRRLSESGLVKHFTAELGGKNPFVIFEDSDIESAVEAAFQGLSFTVSAGQSCQSTAKILVHESIHDVVADYLVQRMKGLNIGPAYIEETQMGPLVSSDQRQRVLRFIESGIEQGASLLTGGSQLERDGYYIEPTLFSGVSQNMGIYQEEIFGPVATLTSFKDTDEAINLANDTRFGLSAAIWTKDLNRALSVSSAIDAGYIWVNDANRHYPGAPFGGMKASGVGREESIDELFSYTEGKAVNIKVDS